MEVHRRSCVAILIIFAVGVCCEKALTRKLTKEDMDFLRSHMGSDIKDLAGTMEAKPGYKEYHVTFMDGKLMCEGHARNWARIKHNQTVSCKIPTAANF